MRILDDIEVLKQVMVDHHKAERVFSEQVRLVQYHLPISLYGALFAGACFFAIMFFSIDLSLNQRPLNLLWIIYHTTAIIFCWVFWRRVLQPPNQLSVAFLASIFRGLAILLIIGCSVSVLMIANIWQSRSLSMIEWLLITLWLLYHGALILLCRLSCQKIKAWAADFQILNQDQQQSLTRYDPSLPNGEHDLTPDYPLKSQRRYHRSDYLSNYTCYRILLINALLVGCLWSIAIGKVVMSHAYSPTQVIVLMGLNFGLLGGAIASIAAFFRVYIALALPSLLTWSVAFIYLYETQMMILAGAVIILLLSYMFFAKHTWFRTQRAILIFLENRNLIKKLQMKSKQVEKARLAQTQFLAAASHDLRQPIHALSLFIAALEDTDLDNTQQQIVSYASSASESSREMLNTILDYAHLELGEVTPHISATALTPLIQNLVDEFAWQTKAKGLSLTFTANNICVMTDPAILSLILRNLISNAIRYTEQGGVTIEAAEVDTNCEEMMLKYCEIRVKDTGEGMSPAEIARIFDSFHQLERNKKNNQGLGLGLAIVKGMARILKAEISVISERDSGSQFAIELPICATDQEIRPPKNNDNDSLTGKRVLVIDDDDSVLKAMYALLKAWGCIISVASSIEEATKAFVAQPPDIVITDFRLTSAGSGEEVLNQLKSLCKQAPPHLKPQFIILTADTAPELIQRTKQLNRTVLHKPISAELLRQTLQAIASELDAVKQAHDDKG